MAKPERPAGKVMMNSLRYLLIPAAFACLPLLGGCGDNDRRDRRGDRFDERSSPAGYREDGEYRRTEYRGDWRRERNVGAREW